MRRTAPAIATAALLLAATGCSPLHGTTSEGTVPGSGTVQEFAPVDRGQPITLTGKDLDGNALSLASFRGKPTVVNVWGSWCTACRAEAPLLATAHQQLGDTAQFVGIDVRDDGTSQAKAYESHFGTVWPSYYSNSGEALLRFPGVLTPNTIPATVVLDSQGRVAARIVGQVPSALTLVEVVRDVAGHG